jgi:hypothetical protein
MNIKDFEKHINVSVLDRGRSYYDSGNVRSVKKVNGEWISSVEGNRDYNVTVRVSDNGTITDTKCNCPYDIGPYCKHQVAVFYTMRDFLNLPSFSKEVDEGTEDLKDILNKLDKETLVSIIMEHSGVNRHFRDKIFMGHSEKADITGYARDIILSAIDEVSRHGYIRYNDTMYAVRGAATVLETADKKIESGDIRAAVSLCMVISEEMMDLIGYCDDSNGYVGGMVYNAVEKIREALSKPDAEKCEGIFDTVLEHSLGPMYDDWSDWRNGLLSALVPLCGVSGNREKMEKVLLDNQSADTEEWSNNYRNKQMQSIQRDIIKRFDGDLAAKQYLENHLENSDFRLIAIRDAIKEDSYDRAVELSLEGEEKDRGYAGLVDNYKKLRYEAYEKKGNIKEIKALGLELAAEGDVEYLQRIKVLYEKDEWPGVVRGIIDTVKTKGRSENYLDILIKEGFKKELLEYCRANLSSIISYHKHLLPEYAKEVCGIFRMYVEESASHANSRDRYRDVCMIIGSYRKVCGKDAYAVRDALKKMYAKRPAFIEELNRI